jgi:hypothetical protein
MHDTTQQAVLSLKIIGSPEKWNGSISWTMTHQDMRIPWRWIEQVDPLVHELQELAFRVDNHTEYVVGEITYITYELHNIKLDLHL